jgi:flagellar biosynthesis GTPase FlhF
MLSLRESRHIVGDDCENKLQSPKMEAQLSDLPPRKSDRSKSSRSDKASVNSSEKSEKKESKEKKERKEKKDNKKDKKAKSSKSKKGEKSSRSTETQEWSETQESTESLDWNQTNAWPQTNEWPEVSDADPWPEVKGTNPWPDTTEWATKQEEVPPLQELPPMEPTVEVGAPSSPWVEAVPAPASTQPLPPSARAPIGDLQTAPRSAAGGVLQHLPRTLATPSPRTTDFHLAPRSSTQAVPTPPRAYTRPMAPSKSPAPFEPQGPRAQSKLAHEHMNGQLVSEQEPSWSPENEPQNRRNPMNAVDMLQWSESKYNDDEVPMERESHGAQRRRFLLKRRLPLAMSSLFESRDKDAPIAVPVDRRRWFGHRASLGGGGFTNENKKQTKIIKHYSTMFNYTEDDDDDNVGLLGTFGSSGESDSRPARRRGSLLGLFGAGRRASTSNLATNSPTTTGTVCLDMESLTSVQ